MNLKVTNPFPLVSLKVLGLGFDLKYDDEKSELKFTFSAVIWEYEKSWQV